MIEETEKGVILTVYVTPNAKKSEIAGFDSWRKALSVKVSAPARGGKANSELIELLREKFGKEVVVVSGEKSRLKKVLIVGCSRREVEENVR